MIPSTSVINVDMESQGSPRETGTVLVLGITGGAGGAVARAFAAAG